MSDFWSRRKAEVEAEERAEIARKLTEETQAEEAQLDEKTDEEILSALDMPPPEEMDSSEQVTAFLKERLPQRLRTRALRRLWGLNPVLANVDGLVDYGEDYTDAATVIENMATVYEVGKGMLGRFAEVEEKPAEDVLGALKDESEIVENSPDQSDEEAPEPLDDTEDHHEAPANTETFADLDPAEQDADQPQNPSRSRRMQFQFREC